MPSVRQQLIASLVRRYPFFSGCGTLANHEFVQRLAGISNEAAWASTPGGQVLAPLNDYVGRAAYYVGDLDRKITWLCKQIVRPGDTALDIGANIGIVSVWLSMLAGNGGNVHAFEPNPQLRENLERLISHNKCTNLKIHPVALGNTEGTLQLTIPQTNAGKATLIGNANQQDSQLTAVKVRRLSTIVKEEAITAIRLIKIDVEGFESEVLEGSREAIQHLRPDAILFEHNSRSERRIQDEPPFKLLDEFDYGFFSIPKCYMNMKTKRLNIRDSNKLSGHDFLAAPKGKTYDDIAKSINAT